MINVYSWPTPNGHKVHIMMEECGFKLGRNARLSDGFGRDFRRSYGDAGTRDCTASNDKFERPHS